MVFFFSCVDNPVPPVPSVDITGFMFRFLFVPAVGFVTLSPFMLSFGSNTF